VTRRGVRLNSIDELQILATNKKSVYCRNCWGLLPAVVVMNMAAIQVHRAITQGEIWTYHREGE